MYWRRKNKQSKRAKSNSSKAKEMLENTAEKVKQQTSAKGIVATKSVVSTKSHAFPVGKKLTNRAVLNVSDEAFAELISIGTSYSPNESGGFGIVKEVEENAFLLDWVWVDKKAKMSNGGVETSTTEIMMYCDEHGIDTKDVNLQWHTHPTFGVFWSATDTTDQVDFLNELITSQRQNFSFWLIVHNMLDFMVRKVIVENGQLSGYMDGDLWLRGVKLGKKHQPVRTYQSYQPYQNNYTASNKPYSGYNYGSAYSYLDEDWDDDEWDYKNGVWSRKSLTTADNKPKSPWVLDEETGAFFHEKSPRGKKLLEEKAAQTPTLVEKSPSGFEIPKWNTQYAINQFPLNYRATTEAQAKNRPEETDRTFATFMGYWSNVYSDYDELFEGLRVTKYNFLNLARRIDTLVERPFYYHILDRPWAWTEFIRCVMSENVTRESITAFIVKTLAENNSKKMSDYLDILDAQTKLLGGGL